jgi:hypothetical protein
MSTLSPTGTVTFGGPLAPYESINENSNSTVREYITEPFTIDRQIELDQRHFLDLKSCGCNDDIIDAATASWSDDPIECIRNNRFHYYLHYIGQTWCKYNATSWDVNDIISLDRIDYHLGYGCKAMFVENFVDGGKPSTSPVVNDLRNFLNAEGRIYGGIGYDLDAAWFVKVYAFRHPFLCLLHKQYALEMTKSKIQFRYSLDALGICAFLHHLTLWSIEYDSQLRQGAPYESGVLQLFPGLGVYHQIPCFVSNGKVGHAIEILYWNVFSRRFVFFDPWPNRSFLSGFLNARVYNSEKTGDNGEKRYEIEPNELAKIMHAVFIPIKNTGMDLLRYGADTKFLFIPWEDNSAQASD